MTINETVKTVHKNAVEHGWWDDERTFGEIVALCHSELSEALESDRAGEKPVWYNTDLKPEGIAVELADCVIRIMDYFGKMGWDLEHIIELKNKYNETRPYKHDKRY